MIDVNDVVMAARDVRADLLRCAVLPRDLAGQCGLAAMRVAAAIGDPRLLRTGFYMKRGRFCGRCGRFPHSHAWCQVGETIVDGTATQFGCRHAVNVVIVTDDDRYIETADGTDAINEIMNNWRGRELPEYKRLAKRLRRRCS